MQRISEEGKVLARGLAEVLNDADPHVDRNEIPEVVITVLRFWCLGQGGDFLTFERWLREQTASNQSDFCNLPQVLDAMGPLRLPLSGLWP